jgi:hypothetical protein
MLKYFFSLLFALVLHAGLVAETELVCKALDPGNVHIFQEGIYVVENEQLLQVKGVFTYGESLYYAKFPSGEKPWMCPNCDFINDKNAITCDGCNWDPRKDPIPFR